MKNTDDHLIDAMAIAICNAIRKDHGLQPIRSLEVVEDADTFRRQAKASLAAYRFLKLGGEGGHMRTQREILDAYRIGDKLSDVELAKLHSDMSIAADILGRYGDAFFIATRYALMIANDCEGIINARRRHRTEAANAS